MENQSVDLICWRNPSIQVIQRLNLNKVMYGYRDVSGVELLMNNHQSLKAEIDTREDNFTACISLGKELLSRNHYASTEVGYYLCQYKINPITIVDHSKRIEIT